MRTIRRLRLISDGAARTEAFGAALGRLLKDGDIICLAGDLGAGKTVLARGIGVGWGAIDGLTSPTYNLAHEHRRACDAARLYHLDFYRISGGDEAETIGFSDMLDDKAALLLEWPERVEAVLPAERLWIDISVRGDDERLLDFEAHGARPISLLSQFAAALESGGIIAPESEAHAAGD